VRWGLVYQAEGTDLLLAGQTPLGELLAAPSAPRLEAISACLIDCDDETRVARLQSRGPEWFARSPAGAPGLPQLGGLGARARHRPVLANGCDPAQGNGRRDALVALDRLARVIPAGVCV
jgi:hypothetical protein